MKEITINTEFIKLDSAMKLGGAVMLGGEAKHLVQDGRVRVNGETELRRGRKLYPGDRFEFDNVIYEIKAIQNDK